MPPSPSRSIFFWAPDHNLNEKGPHQWVVLGSEGWVDPGGGASSKGLHCNYCWTFATDTNRNRWECVPLRERLRLERQGKLLTQSRQKGGTSDPNWQDDSLDDVGNFAMYPVPGEPDYYNARRDWYSEPEEDSEEAVEELFAHESDSPAFGEADDDGA